MLSSEGEKGVAVWTNEFENVHGRSFGVFLD